MSSSNVVSTPKFWSVVPAAGVGQRMAANVPKQYLSLAGKTIIEHSVGRLCAHPRIEGVCVVVSANDGWWPDLPIASAAGVMRADGGAERCHSVLNGLRALAGHASRDASSSDWVLVHDAARPCIHADDIDALLAVADDVDAIGGILAHPVRDTMKRARPQGKRGTPLAITTTVDRDQLWHAFTPQMFRLGLLEQALSDALANDILVTDEASAMEAAGFAPLLVEGRADNIKVTRPEDLALAEFYLSQQHLLNNACDVR